MKILITGATGLLGSRFHYILSKRHNVIGTYFSKPKREFYYLSLLNRSSIDFLISETRPDIVIHTAGIVNPDKCEENKKKAHKVNAKGIEYIVDACKKSKSLLIFISSAHIFSERQPLEKESPKPLNYCGQTKLEAERYIKRNLKNYIILRPTELYGFSEDSESKDFTKKVIKKFKDNKELRMDNVLKYYPVITDDVIRLTQSLIDLGLRGVYNISSSKPYTKYEWAKLIAGIFNLDKSKLKSVKKKVFVRDSGGFPLPIKKIRRLNFHPLSLKKGIEQLKKQMGCSFNLIYSFRPYKMIEGKSANVFRINLGKALAQQESLNNFYPDMVVPIPETGIYSAQGYAHKLGVPLYHAIVRDEVKKTLYEPYDKRIREIRKKLIIIPDLVKGKKIVVIDEAIISGLMMSRAVEMLKNAGAKEIHIRVPAPIMFNNCKYNVLAKDAKLIAKKLQGHRKEVVEKKLAKHFSVNSLKYLSLEIFQKSLPNGDLACLDCFKKKL